MLAYFHLECILIFLLLLLFLFIVRLRHEITQTSLQAKESNPKHQNPDRPCNFQLLSFTHTDSVFL